MKTREQLEVRAKELHIIGNIARMKDETLERKIKLSEEELAKEADDQSKESSASLKEMIGEDCPEGAIVHQEIMGAILASPQAEAEENLDEFLEVAKIVETSDEPLRELGPTPLEASEKATVELIGVIDKTDNNEIISVAEKILEKHDIPVTLENVNGIVQAAARYPELKTVYAHNIDVPTSYRHSEGGPFGFAGRVIPAGETFTPTKAELSDEMTLKRFNHAYETGAIVKA